MTFQPPHAFRGRSPRRTLLALATLLVSGLALGLPAAPLRADDEAAFGPEEIAGFVAAYQGATPEEQAEMRQFLLDMGIDITAFLGGAPPPADGAAPATAPALPPGESALLKAVKATDFARNPAAVLAARSQMGFTPAPRPDLADSAVAAEAAKWLHLQVMAGEWENFRAFIADIPEEDAPGVYAHVLQSLNKPQKQEGNNRPDPALLPEEILAIADAAPEEFSDWQYDVLGQLMRGAATKYSTAPMLESIERGTRLFGKETDSHRVRAVRLLVASGLVVDAARFFPSLDDARARKDAKALLNYGRYRQDLASLPGGDADRDALLAEAWTLFGEVALMPGADAAQRQDGLRRAVDLMPDQAPGQVKAWLSKVFADPALAPAALEAIALKATSQGAGQNASGDGDERRALTLATMKEAVDELLAQTGVDVAQVRVPLRMLTTALVGEAERALGIGGDGGNQRRGRQGADLGLLMRSMPDEGWLEVLEPSLASRAYHAAIAVALAANETDAAIDRLGHAVRRFPGQGVEFADRFMRRWAEKVGDRPDIDTEFAFYGFVRGGMSGAPLTRGRQRRNLDQLTRLIAVLDAIGVDARRLPSTATVFSACHGATEVFTQEGVEGVFGPIDAMAPRSAAALADRMRAGLSSEWRDRRAQQAAGMKRSAPEIAAMVERGYALALLLADRAVAGEPDAWSNAVTKAGLAFDRVQFKQEEAKADFTTYNQYRKEAFAAFAQTAERYADLVRGGTQRDDPGVYLAWFSAAVGGTELNYLTRDDLLVEGSPQDDQIDLIRKAITALPDEAAERHVGAFAQALDEALPGIPPDVKPRVVRHALRIVGDHPQGASLRRLAALYQDLVKDEIKLRLVIDGDDRIGGDRRFAATLSLRFTAAVDRETGGFSRYLQNDVWARVGNSYRPMNHRDQLRKDIDSAFRERFEVEAIGFFEAMAPPRPVREGGDDGWLEKPLAYVLLKARDPSVDRLPAVSMDMVFNDMLGPVTLPLVSDAPPIDAATAVTAAAPGLSTGDSRPVRKLQVAQTLDLRDVIGGERRPQVTLEIEAKGEGVLPELDALLPGYRTALAGFEVAAGGVEARPINMIETEPDTSSRFYGFMRQKPDKPHDYSEPDENGRYRLPIERSWLVSYTPTGGPVGEAFTLPALGPGIEGTLVARQYSDMDVVAVATPTVPIARAVASGWAPAFFAAIAAIAGVLAVLIAAGRGRGERREALRLPERMTPMSVIGALRRIESDEGAALAASDRRSLADEIAALEAAYFAPAANGHPGANHHADVIGATDDLRERVVRWTRAARG